MLPKSRKKHFHNYHKRIKDYADKHGITFQEALDYGAGRGMTPHAVTPKRAEIDRRRLERTLKKIEKLTQSKKLTQPIIQKKKEKKKDSS